MTPRPGQGLYMLYFWLCVFLMHNARCTLIITRPSAAARCNGYSWSSTRSHVPRRQTSSRCPGRASRERASRVCSQPNRSEPGRNTTTIYEKKHESLFTRTWIRFSTLILVYKSLCWWVNEKQIAVNLWNSDKIINISCDCKLIEFIFKGDIILFLLFNTCTCLLNSCVFNHTL